MSALQRSLQSPCFTFLILLITLNWGISFTRHQVGGVVVVPVVPVVGDVVVVVVVEDVADPVVLLQLPVEAGQVLRSGICCWSQSVKWETSE